MNIGLISDTHYPEAPISLPDVVLEVFSSHKVEMILHAGDIYDPACLDWLEKVAPTLACEGNGDFFRKIKDPRIEPTRVISVEGFNIGLTHGLAIPEIPPRRTIESVMDNEFGQPVDIIVFGDTHTEEVVQVKNVLCINPGSPTLPHNLDHIIGTVGILELNEGSPPITKIIHLESMEELDMENPIKWWSVR
ncbi:MAG: metallophosphoesterase family protein [Dehalococcoidia bacterium]